MRFFTATLVALSTLGAAVFAAENPLSFPSAGDKLEAGKTYIIKWTPTTPDQTIDLVLRRGDSGDLDTLGPIVESTDNDGEYEWKVPEDLSAGDSYAVEIKYEGGENYTPQFVIDSDVTAPTTTETTTTATETETETETETATETETETETETATETETETETETTTTAEETTTTEETTATSTTLITSTITSAPNNTITTSSSSTRTSPPRTTSTDDEEDDAPDTSDAGLGKVISSGFVVLVGAAWALML